uniref:alginate export family protein n=1 Tax=Ningiella ruwaisensis TaxID=2364274 RepID=UPI0010A003D8|nr:alginate export family protein [Ningiella ruwaisensis]
MKTRLATLIGASLVGLGALSTPTMAANDFSFANFQSAITEGDADLTLRYRYERVSQDNIDKTANASTLLTRLSYTSGDFNGFFAVVEFDNVSAIGNENYNSTVNGNVQYPVVADPTDTETNQAYVGYKAGDFVFSAGRQRINHNDQRFIGGVAWRQNEQTYDGYRLQYNGNQGLHVDYSFIHNVNRIFGTDSPNSDLAGNLHLLNTHYQINDKHKVTGFAYSLDFDLANAISTKTIGASYDGTLAMVTVHASLARQSEEGDNPNDFSADYLALELSTPVSGVNLGIGYESLGSDNGVGFSTPLATLHKFQGFADKFLNTPAQGVNDLYVKASGKLGDLKLSAIYHQLESDVGSIDYGNELNLVANYPLAKNTGLLLKYANYSADEFSVDSNKFWAMVTAKF